MATQLAPTPTVKGRVAKAVRREMRRKPTQASRRGARILASKFDRMTKQNPTRW